MQDGTYKHTTLVNTSEDGGCQQHTARQTPLNQTVQGSAFILNTHQACIIMLMRAIHGCGRSSSSLVQITLVTHSLLLFLHIINVSCPRHAS